ncbi:TPA: fimbrial protein [Aeromonas veronii]
MKFNVLFLIMLGSSGVAMAAPMVTFQGEVTQQTCTISIAGNTAGTVLLPTVTSAELSATNSKAGLTPFTITIDGCAKPSSDLALKTNFLGHNVTAAGNLGNKVAKAAGGAEKVALQLTKEADGLVPVTLNGVTAVAISPVPAGQTGVTHTFGVQYISEAGGATAGAVEGVAEYTISYL